jgi:putative restriction endonuclease
MGNSPGKPPKKDRPPEVFPDGRFPEGKKKEKLHFTHERNRTVVERAKQYAWQRDKTLPCEVCKFSFVDEYGELGEKFIEAHHIYPVAGLQPRQGTKVEDIALVCANCHRMLHGGKKTLTIEELKSLRS